MGSRAGIMTWDGQQGWDQGEECRSKCRAAIGIRAIDARAQCCGRMGGKEGEPWTMIAIIGPLHPIHPMAFHPMALWALAMVRSLATDPPGVNNAACTA